MPSRVKINQDVVGMRSPLKISGALCTRNYDASTQLVHSTDSFFMAWDGSGPDVQQVYAWEVKPGTYRTTGSDCYSYDNNYNTLSCTVTRASTVIKFASRPKLSISRDRSVVDFHVVASRYFDYNGFRPVRNTVAIQRRVGTKWVTIHRAVAVGKAGYAWHYRRVRSSAYRALSFETAAAFSGTSRTTTR